jgi:hypothetical protein
MFTDFHATPNLSALKDLTTAPVLTAVKTESGERAIFVLRQFTSIALSESYSHLSKNRIAVPLQLFLQPNENFNRKIGPCGTLSFEMTTEDGSQGWMLVLQDLSCLIAYERTDLYSAGYGRWVEILPVPLQIPSIVRSKFIGTTLRLRGPNTRDNAAIKVKVADRKFVDLLKTEEILSSDIDPLSLEGFSKALDITMRQWANLIPKMPMIQVPQRGEPLTGTVNAQNSPFATRKSIGKPCAWPDLFEHRTHTDAEIAKLEDFVHMATVHLVEKNPDVFETIKVVVTAGRTTPRRTTPATVEVYARLLKFKVSQESDMESYKWMLRSILTSEKSPLNFLSVEGSEFYHTAKDNDQSDEFTAESHPERIVNVEIDSQVNAHDRIRAIAMFQDS